MIKKVCVISILCGAADYLCPDGLVRTVMKIICSAAVIVTMLTSYTQLDTTEYAVDMAKYRAKQDEILQNGEDKREELDRLVIASECEAYIKDKAVQYGAVISQIEVCLEWSREGVWVPCSLRGCALNEESCRIAGEIAKTELGIASEKQEWSIYGSEE